MRTLKDKKMTALKLQLAKNLAEVKTKVMSYVSLPTEDAHSGHPTGGGVAGFSQKMNSQVASRLAEIVAEGITEKGLIRTLLRQFVMKELWSKTPPDKNDRAFFST